MIVRVCVTGQTLECKYRLICPSKFSYQPEVNNFCPGLLLHNMYMYMIIQMCVFKSYQFLCSQQVPPQYTMHMLQYSLNSAWFGAPETVSAQIPEVVASADSGPTIVFGSR